MKKQYQSFPSTDVRKAITDTETEYGKINLILMIIGLLFLIGGFVMMNYVDAEAKNIFAYIAPITIITSLITIVFALLIEPDFTE